MNYQERYQKWLTSEAIDQETKVQLHQMDENQIRESFYDDLEFGTGGLRGIIGPGTNRMNRYTVQKATQGLANYIARFGETAKQRGVAIAYDSRKFSREFAEDAALVLNANGIKTHLFTELQPTPLLSFAVRELQAIAGIVVTASHNPPQYNGYKVYWEDGGQIVPGPAEEIIAEIKLLNEFHQIKTTSRAEAERAGLFCWIEHSIEDRFIEILKSYSYIDDNFRQSVADLKIIYTPLHGTGNKPVRRILRELGFRHVTVVPKQELPDANFSTVKYPNPEEKDAFNLAIEMAKDLNPDLIIGTDPDCDRIGVVEQTSDGEYCIFSGNQVGVLLSEYLLSRRKESDQLPANSVIIKTIVTTEMVGEVAKKYGVHIVDTLTGFKFIGEKIKEYMASGEYEYIFGFEESYGYLAGTHARDKDAVVAAALICEMAAYYRAQGLSLTEQLSRLMEEYGYYMEALTSMQFEGIAGQKKIQQMLYSLRQDLPLQIGQRQVISVEDYELRQKTNILTGHKEALYLPQSNVLRFFMNDRSCFTIRPSGTEPKVKIYISVAGKSEEDAKDQIKQLETDVLNLINQTDISEN